MRSSARHDLRHPAKQQRDHCHQDERAAQIEVGDQHADERRAAKHERQRQEPVLTQPAPIELAQLSIGERRSRRREGAGIPGGSFGYPYLVHVPVEGARADIVADL